MSYTAWRLATTSAVIDCLEAALKPVAGVSGVIATLEEAASHGAKWKALPKYARDRDR